MVNFEERFGFALDKAFSKIISDLVAEDLLTIDERQLRLTPRGILLYNEVVLKFF